MSGSSEISPSELSALASAYGRLGAQLSWAKTADRSGRTAPARRALEQKWLDQAEGDPIRAEHLRKAHYQRMALKSAAARRAKRAGRTRSTAALDDGAQA